MINSNCIFYFLSYFPQITIHYLLLRCFKHKIDHNKRTKSKTILLDFGI